MKSEYCQGLSSSLPLEGEREKEREGERGEKRDPGNEVGNFHRSNLGRKSSNAAHYATSIVKESTAAHIITSRLQEDNMQLKSARTIL